MRNVIVNSKGQVHPARVSKERRDVTALRFDFSNLFSAVDSYTIEGDAPITGDSQDGTSISVTLDASSCRTYDLIVKAVSGSETRAATVQVQAVDRERGYAGDYC